MLASNYSVSICDKICILFLPSMEKSVTELKRELLFPADVRPVS